MILRLLMAQAIVSFLAIGATSVYGTAHQLQSVAVGAGFVGLNLLLLAMAWHWILSKKLIALAVSVIVFKYAIFGIILYVIITQQLVDSVWFVIGVTTLLPGLLIFTLGMGRQRNPSSW